MGVAAQSKRGRALSPDSLGNRTEEDEPQLPPPRKKARLTRQAAVHTVADTNTIAAFGEQIALVRQIKKKPDNVCFSTNDPCGYKGPTHRGE